MNRTILTCIFVLTVTACGSGDATDGDEDPANQDAAPETTTIAVSTALQGSEGPDADVPAWCAIERERYDFDPADPASVQKAFELNLAFDQERAENAPPEIAEAAGVVLAETDRFVGELEEAGWNLDAVSPEIPPEAQAAEDALIEFEVEVCGEPDPRP